MAVEGAGNLPAGSRGLYGVCLAGVQSRRKAASDRHCGFDRCRGLCGRRCGDPPPCPDPNPNLKEISVTRKRGRQREYAAWKASSRPNKRTRYNKGGSILTDVPALYLLKSWFGCLNSIPYQYILQFCAQCLCYKKRRL